MAEDPTVEFRKQRYLDKFKPYADLLRLIREIERVQQEAEAVLSR